MSRIINLFGKPIQTDLYGNIEDEKKLIIENKVEESIRDTISLFDNQLTFKF